MKNNRVVKEKREVKLGYCEPPCCSHCEFCYITGAWSDFNYFCNADGSATPHRAQDNQKWQNEHSVSSHGVCNSFSIQKGG